MITADRREDYSDFCGPRIAPGLRWKRMMDREADTEKWRTWVHLQKWVGDWRRACIRAGGIENMTPELAEAWERDAREKADRLARLCDHPLKPDVGFLWARCREIGRRSVWDGAIKDEQVGRHE